MKIKYYINNALKYDEYKNSSDSDFKKTLSKCLRNSGVWILYQIDNKILFYRINEYSKNNDIETLLYLTCFGEKNNTDFFIIEEKLSDEFYNILESNKLFMSEQIEYSCFTIDKVYDINYIKRNVNSSYIGGHTSQYIGYSLYKERDIISRIKQDSFLLIEELKKLKNYVDFFEDSKKVKSLMITDLYNRTWCRIEKTLRLICDKTYNQLSKEKYSTSSMKECIKPYFENIEKIYIHDIFDKEKIEVSNEELSSWLSESFDLNNSIKHNFSYSFDHVDLYCLIKLVIIYYIVLIFGYGSILIEEAKININEIVNFEIFWKESKDFDIHKQILKSINHLYLFDKENLEKLFMEPELNDSFNKNKFYRIEWIPSTFIVFE